MEHIQSNGAQGAQLSRDTRQTAKSANYVLDSHRKLLYRHIQVFTAVSKLYFLYEPRAIIRKKSKFTQNQKDYGIDLHKKIKK